MARYVPHAERERAEREWLDEVIRIAVRLNQFTVADAVTQFRQAAARGDVWPWWWDPPRERDNSPPPPVPGEHNDSQAPVPPRAPRRTPLPPGLSLSTSTPTSNEPERRWPPRGSSQNPEQHWSKVKINPDTGEIFDDFGMSKSYARRHAKRRRLSVSWHAQLLQIWGVTAYLLERKASAASRTSVEPATRVGVTDDPRLGLKDDPTASNDGAAERSSASLKSADETTPPPASKRARGPKRGSSPYRQQDLALIVEVEPIVAVGTTHTSAFRQLAQAGRIPGGGTEDSKIKRLLGVLANATEEEFAEARRRNSLKVATKKLSETR